MDTKKRFICKRCGGCCGIVPFTKSEYKKVLRIAKRMHLSFVKTEFEGNLIYFEKSIYKKFCDLSENKKEFKSKDLYCRFLEFDKNKKASCKIYDLRPQTCKDFGNKESLKCLNSKKNDK